MLKRVKTSTAICIQSVAILLSIGSLIPGIPEMRVQAYGHGSIEYVSIEHRPNCTVTESNTEYRYYTTVPIGWWSRSKQNYCTESDPECSHSLWITKSPFFLPRDGYGKIPLLEPFPEAIRHSDIPNMINRLHGLMPAASGYVIYQSRHVVATDAWEGSNEWPWPPKISKPLETDNGLPRYFILSDQEVQKFLSTNEDKFTGIVEGTGTLPAFDRLDTQNCDTLLRSRSRCHPNDFGTYMDTHGTRRPCHLGKGLSDPKAGTRLHFNIACWMTNW
jgi:hypothetical protein